MNKVFITSLVFSLLVAAGCTTGEKADLVITGGKIFTADSLMPYAEAVAVIPT